VLAEWKENIERLVKDRGKFGKNLFYVFLSCLGKSLENCQVRKRIEKEENSNKQYQSNKHVLCCQALRPGLDSKD